MAIRLSVNLKSEFSGVLVLVELIKNDCNVEIVEGNQLNLVVSESNFSTVPSVLRYLARVCPKLFLYGDSILEKTEIDHWLSFANRISCSNSCNDALQYLQCVLASNTYLVAHHLTIADIAIWGALRASNVFQQMMASGTAPNHLKRYYNFLLNEQAFKKVDEMVPSATEKIVASNNSQGGKVKKEEGKFIQLEGAKMGEVVVRFPPEASGYLHVGHAKAALLNQYYQQTFEGKLIMRFDDTNPAKESAEFEKVILEDLKMLGIKPDIFTHTSDHFDRMLSMCEKMLKDGTAYADDTDPEQMKKEREERQCSKHRDNSAAQNLKMWDEMKRGTNIGMKCCVRAKLDMSSDNGCLRDPTIYRCKSETHVKTGDKYKVYPTYDFACPIVDSVEGVTHALRTTEYHDRDDQYRWFINTLGLRNVHVWEYSRLNLQNTVMSKRKLTWFVNEGLVSGWDDPRFPTVRGVLRRGMTVEALKQFVIAQGSSRSINMMEWDKIWAVNKKVIDPIVPRYVSLTEGAILPVHVQGAKEESKQVQKHPKNVDVGMKTVWYNNKIFIDSADALTFSVGETVTFINWGNLIIKGINKDNNGVITSVDATLNLDNKDYKKTTKLTWLAETDNAPFIPLTCVHFDHIINKGVLDKKDDFKDYINKDSKHEVGMIGDPELKYLKKGDIVQLQRRGYYICDAPYEAASRYTGRPTPCVLFHIPDGHTKEMPSAGSKHKDNKKEAQTNKNVKSSDASKDKNNSSDDEKTLSAKITAQGDNIRDLKTKKADKKVIQEEVQVLLSLKEDYKRVTGNDWKPGAAPVPEKTSSSGQLSVVDLYNKIQMQGDRIRKLKAEKASKETITGDVKILLELKAEYKNITGVDWKPDQPPTVVPETTTASKGVSQSSDADLYDKVDAQADKVRRIKSEKASKESVQAEVKVLLSMKADYKNITGVEWKAGQRPVTKEAVTTPQTTAAPQAAQLYNQVVKQGDLVRSLKAQKAKKEDIDSGVKSLLALKKEYKELTGSDWKPGVPPAQVKSTTMSSDDSQQLKAQIDVQGNKVRELKSSGAAKQDIDAAVKELLELKSKYKLLTGEDLSGGAKSKKDKKGSNKENQKPKAKQDVKSNAAEGEMKKVTRLGIEFKKEENLPDWYSQVITKAEMIEYYDVSGCYVLRPWSYGLWERIAEYVDKTIKGMGFTNAYFPMFVSNAALQREKDHIEDFAPEVAWVTRSGETELAEPIAIRPTSETVMYPAYAKWVQSHRDLPIKINQWCSVVRWEFKHPQPFLRTREFLWHEGHSAYATYKEAEEEVYQIIDMYEDIYEKMLAIPVVKGKKTIKEKFAGGDYTTTVEAYISATGRAIQAATSHHLGQNFSKMFDISFEDPNSATKEKEFAYQNSWAITTRSIGVLVMVHGDNKGLVLPPNIANHQVVIVPCGITASLTDADKNKLYDSCHDLNKQLKAAGIRSHADYRDNYSPGWKFNHWELKGVPVRIEIGPRDMKELQVMAVRRDNGEKSKIQRANVVDGLKQLLDVVQQALFDKAKKEIDNNIAKVYTFEDFCSNLDNKKLLLAPFCGEIPCEDQIKKLSARDAVVEEGAPAMGAKGLCIPFKQPEDITDGMKCVCPGCNKKPQYFTLFGRSY